MKPLYLILIIGFSIQFYKMSKLSNKALFLIKFNQLIIEFFHSSPNEKDFKILLGEIKTNHYFYEKYVVHKYYLKNNYMSPVRPLNFILANLFDFAKEDDFVTNKIFINAFNLLESEILYNTSSFLDKHSKERLKLLNPIYYLWNFFDYIYEPMFNRINKYGKTLSNFVGTISTILTAFYGVHIFFKKLDFNIINFFSKFFMKFF